MGSIKVMHDQPTNIMDQKSLWACRITHHKENMQMGEMETGRKQPVTTIVKGVTSEVTTGTLSPRGVKVISFIVHVGGKILTTGIHLLAITRETPISK